MSNPARPASQRKRQSRATKSNGHAKRTRYTAPDEWDKRTYCSVLRVSNTSAAACPPLTLPTDMSTATLDCDTSLLAASLYPLPVDEFKKEYWRRRAVAIVGAGSARVELLIAEELCELDVRELMAASASEQIFVWMKERHANTDTASSSSSSSSSQSSLAKQPITSFPLDNPNQLDAALACYNSGSSLYFRSPPSLAHRFVRAFNAAVGFNFAGLDYSSISSSSQPKGEIEVFVSRAGHHTGYHFDFMDNFTVQLSGKKTWTFGAVDVQHPVRGFTPHYKDRSTDELQYKVHSACQGGVYEGREPVRCEQVTLSAGDVLYHPAGIWHAVSCEEDSVSINISLIATTAADLISDAVRQLLWRTDAGRAGLCGTVGDMHTQLLQALATLKTIIVDKKLTAGAILPAAMMAPRQRQPVNIDSDVDKRMLIKNGRECELSAVFGIHDRYSFNPLMTITPFRGGEEEEEEEEEGENADEEDDSHEEVAADALNELKEIEDAERGQREQSASDERKEEQKERDGRQGRSENNKGEDEDEHEDDEVEYAQYVLHHLFGNESVDSAMRIVLRVHRALQPTFDALISPHNKRADEAVPVWQVVESMSGSTLNVDVDQSDEVLEVARCLYVLSELGFVTASTHPTSTLAAAY